ncbi:MAG: hypothetical protein EOP84_06630 [Verrucomicrobiaceae bacterium]|nr:MAG: hypothetical protein EOP84_06630 [Verrucomicrobiaceae bacterium]
MMRPIYRWKSFWLGAFAIASIAWAWEGSYDTSTSVVFRRLAFSQRAGYTMTAILPPGPSFQRPLQRYGVNRGEYEFELFPSPFFATGQGRVPVRMSSDSPINFRANMEQTYVSQPTTRKILCVPHWLIVATFLIPWAFFLVWRWRMIRRPVSKSDLLQS